MPTHKTTNEFIKKYNKEFAFKGYSKMNIHDKIRLVEEKLVNAPRRMKHIKNEWTKLKETYHTDIKIDKKKTETRPKTTKKWTIEDVQKKLKKKKY
jgi:hypothetical protein